MARIVHHSYMEIVAQVKDFQSRFMEAEISCKDDLPDQIANITQCHPYHAQLAFQQTILHYSTSFINHDMMARSLTIATRNTTALSMPKSWICND